MLPIIEYGWIGRGDLEILSYWSRLRFSNSSLIDFEFKYHKICAYYIWYTYVNLLFNYHYNLLDIKRHIELIIGWYLHPMI